MFTSVSWTEHVCVVCACMQSFARNAMCCVLCCVVLCCVVLCCVVLCCVVLCCVVLCCVVLCCVCCVCHIKEIVLCVFANNSNQATTGQEVRGYVNMSVSGNI